MEWLVDNQTEVRGSLDKEILALETFYKLLKRAIFQRKLAFKCIYKQN